LSNQSDQSAPAEFTSLTENVSAFSAEGHVLKAGFLKDEPVFVLAEGEIMIGERRVAPHHDAGILNAVFDGETLLTGGDDGRVIRTLPSGESETLAHEKGKWIDALTASHGAVAWAVGKKISARDKKGEIKTIDMPSTPQGLCFMPKGYRLAISQYGGAVLWFPNVEAAPDKLEWKGAHLDIIVSPDARFIVTSMQENALHGWRLSDNKDMRMTGYPSKTRSFSWSHDGEWLATSGADAAIVWPFKDKDGPMGKAPRECGVRSAKVSCVAFHPKALVVAIGYDDSCILMCRLTDAAELLVRRASRMDGKVSALAWDEAGRHLAFGTEGGAAGILTLP
jgi:WD40 repeat protein